MLCVPPLLLGNCRKFAHLEQGADIQDQGNPPVTKNGCPGRTFDPAVIGLNALDNHLMLVQKSIYQHGRLLPVHIHQHQNAFFGLNDRRLQMKQFMQRYNRYVFATDMDELLAVNVFEAIGCRLEGFNY